MNILNISPKGRDTDTWKQIFINNFNKEGIAMNVQHTNQNITLFELNKRWIWDVTMLDLNLHLHIWHPVAYVTRI
jgi:hypothetical protein